MTDIKTMKATDMSPRDGLITVVAGPPGLGKSWFCGTKAEYLDPDEVLLIATLPREVKSTKYQQHDLDTVLIYDGDWRPKQERLVANGFDELQNLLEELREDTQYKGIIIDNGTEAAEMAWHKSLEPFGVASPTDIRGRSRWDPYTTLDSELDEFARNLQILAGGVPQDMNIGESPEVAQPKLITIPWHVQPPKEKPGDSDDSADEKGQGTEYEGKNLPMIRGRFRRRLQQLVDGFVYVDTREETTKAMKTEMKYKLQIRSDPERHVKVPGEVPDEIGKFIDPHYQNYMDIIPGDDDE